MDLSKLCRLCCKENVEFVSLLENNGPVYLKSLINVDIKNSDDLPKKSCLDCWDSLKNAYLIQQKFLQSDQYIRHEYLHTVNKDVIIFPNPSLKIENHQSKECKSNFSDNNHTPLRSWDKRIRYTCNICHKSYKYAVSLKKHCILTHSNKVDNIIDTISCSNNSNLSNCDINKERSLKNHCLMCSKVFKSRKLFFAHKQNHIKKECLECGIKVGKYNFNSHMKIHKDVPQKCKICKQILKNRRTLQSHIKTVHNVNTNSTNFKQICYICGKHLKCERILKKHLKNIHDIFDENTRPIQSDFDCSECSKHFSDRQKYLAHINNHRKKECPLCKQKISRFNFTKHVRLHSEEPKKCHLCDATCKNSESLRGHLFYTHSTKEYKCDICNKTYKKNYDRIIHIKKDHTGERNHTCHLCGKGFITLFHLKNHIKIHHSDAKPYTCSVCEKGFTNMKALLQHERHHLGDHSYTCDLCMDTFPKKVNLRNHKYSQHKTVERKRSDCDQCEKVFSSEFALKTHIYKIHKEIKAK